MYVIFKIIAEEQNPYTDEEWRAHNNMGQFSQHIAIAIALISVTINIVEGFSENLWAINAS